MDDIKLIAKIWYEKIKAAFARARINGLIVAAVTILATVLVFIELILSITVNVGPAPIPTPTPDYNVSCKRKIGTTITTYFMKDSHRAIYDKPGPEGQVIGKLPSDWPSMPDSKYLDGNKLYINIPEFGWVHICTENWTTGRVVDWHYKDAAQG